MPKFATYAKAIEAKAREHGIEVLTEMAPDEVSEFLRTATVALLPLPTGASFRRGSLLAAAVCGVPIVTSWGTETPAEMIRLLEPATSRTELIEQAAAYLADGARREAAHDRTRQLAAMVDWNTIADRYIDLFSRLKAHRLA